jgi:hypothetical protein
MIRHSEEYVACVKYYFIFMYMTCIKINLVLFGNLENGLQFKVAEFQRDFFMGEINAFMCILQYLLRKHWAALSHLSC